MNTSAHVYGDIEATMATVALPVLEESKIPHDLTPMEQSIVKCLIIHDRLMQPWEIGEYIGKTPGSVSARLTKLRINNVVLWKLGGYYEVNPLYGGNQYQIWGDFGGGLIGWRVQNVSLRVVGVPVGTHEKLPFEFGDVGLSIEFGSTRSKISVYIGSDLGLDYSHWLMVLDKMDSVCSERGYEGLDWRVYMCEVLRDYESRRLDGVSGYTLTRFNESVIEKIYAKPGDVVRHERRIHPDKLGADLGVDVISSFLANGLQGMDFARAIHRLQAELASWCEIMKIQNKRLYEIEKAL